MVPTTLSRFAGGLSRYGRELFSRHLALAPFTRSRAAKLPAGARMRALVDALLTSRGEASGVAIAAEFLHLYKEASVEERRALFGVLATAFSPDPVKLQAAWAQYQADGADALPRLSQAVESPRQELFRRLNLAPGGTAALVEMRADLLEAARTAPNPLAAVDADLAHLLKSWFNRGFLTMAPIDWSSPARLLERVIRYEAVHQISDWDDLRRRLAPSDRRCFGFFHPAMPGEPLIFVEVALSREIATNIQDVLDPDRTIVDPEEATVAIFYSISNCQPGLKGISFGHFLIKQVASDLKRDLPRLTCFATLSPIPGLGVYLSGHDAPPFDEPLGNDQRDTLMRHAAAYLAQSKSRDGKPADPVARFHLGNGAELHRLNWRADLSPTGVEQSAGMMVNYVYDLSRIEANHEAYVHEGTIPYGEAFRRLAADLMPLRS